MSCVYCCNKSMEQQDPHNLYYKGGYNGNTSAPYHAFLDVLAHQLLMEALPHGLD